MRNNVFIYSVRGVLGDKFTVKQMKEERISSKRQHISREESKSIGLMSALQNSSAGRLWVLR